MKGVKSTMILSKDAFRLLKRTIKVYRKRIRTNAENPTWFRAFQIEKEFKNTRIKDFDLALQELGHLELIRLYTDGGFAITSKALSYYEHDRKAPWIKIVWFVLGLFTEWLLCKGFDIGFEQVCKIISQIAKK